MNRELPLGQETDEIQGLTQVVAESLARGDDPSAIAQKLIDSGWEPDQAHAFVGSIHQQMYENAPSAAGGQEGESGGWLLWIGGILGINFLSWLFDWGFWIY
jgi:hypothetical protein